jgi:hypothetical protein
VFDISFSSLDTKNVEAYWSSLSSDSREGVVSIVVYSFEDGLKN